MFNLGIHFFLDRRRTATDGARIALNCADGIGTFWPSMANSL
jgi:hypothetical protein